MTSTIFHNTLPKARGKKGWNNNANEAKHHVNPFFFNRKQEYVKYAKPTNEMKRTS